MRPVKTTAPTEVAVLVKRFPRLSETFILHEFCELRRQGLPVRLYALGDPGEAVVQPEAARLRHEVRYVWGGGWWRRLPAMGRTVRRHPRGALRGLGWVLAHPGRASLRHLAQALSFVDALPGPTTAHVHAHFANGPTSVAHLAHLVSGVGFSFTAHAKDLFTTPPELVRERAAAARAVITCTAANRDHFTAAVGVDAGDVTVCHHGVAFGLFAAVARRPRPGRILTVGRLVPKKGFDVLLDACRLLADRGVEFDCRIIGDGAMARGLTARIAELGLTGRVRLEGSCDQRGVAAACGQAEVFALAPTVQADGDRDGIPNVVLEAMAAGLPVVSTAVSGLPEAVLDGVTGTLVAPGDPTALADALAALLADRGLRERFGAAGRRRAERHFALEGNVAALAARLRSAAGLPGDPAPVRAVPAPAPTPVARLDPPGLLHWCHHSVGLGHLTRSAAIDAALSARFRVVLASGGAVPPGFAHAGFGGPDGIELVELPVLGHDAHGRPTSPDPGRTGEQAAALRSSTLLATYRELRPAAVLVEMFPLGRRRFAAELAPLLEEARRDGAAVICSVRDILVTGRRDQRAHDDRAARALNRWFDAVLVHADPRLARLEATFTPTVAVEPPIHYTGLVAPDAPAPPPWRAGSREVLVSAGGGLVGEPLLRLAIAAQRHHLADRGLTMRLLTGPFLDAAAVDRLRAEAAGCPGLVLERYLPDLCAAMARAAVSVSQCGYNTAIDVLRAGVPAVLVPYDAATETEQTDRARRLAELGVARFLPLGGASAQCLAEHVLAALDGAPPALRLDLDGAAATAGIVAGLVHGRAGADVPTRARAS